MPQFLDTKDAGFEAAFEALLSAKREDSPDVDAVVADIIADVRARGDAAVESLVLELEKGLSAYEEAARKAAAIKELEGMPGND